LQWIDFLSLFHHFLRCLRTLYIVWSLVRRRVTWCLTRLQTMCSVLKYRKILRNVALRLRCGCVYFFNLLKTSTVWHCGCHKYGKGWTSWQLLFSFALSDQGCHSSYQLMVVINHKCNTAMWADELSFWAFYNRATASAKLKVPEL